MTDNLFTVSLERQEKELSKSDESMKPTNTRMNINKLEELAKAATPGPWLCDWPMDEIEDENEPADVSVWQRELFSGKFINNICSDNAIIDGNYIAAANPSAILELIAAYREAVAALEIIAKCIVAEDCRLIAVNAVATAKRLGVE